MGQTELLKQVVAAVQDTERGKHAPMTALLLEEQDRAQRQRQPAEDLDRSRTEVGSAHAAATGTCCPIRGSFVEAFKVPRDRSVAPGAHVA